MKNEERREQTTRQLLNATKSLIREKGCHAITMQDIMNESGLSKGAIFHYVKSKDEIFAWVLQESLEETNELFNDQVKREPKTFDGPMQAIARSLTALENPQDVTNKVFVYLIGKEDNPAVAEVLHRFYDRAVTLSRNWIAAGQRHGVIPESVDTAKTSELFVLLSLGLRVRSTVSEPGDTFTARDLSAFMTSILQHSSKGEIQ